MKHITILLLLMVVSSCTAQATKMFEQEHFVITKNETLRFKQVKDSLYINKCSSLNTCDTLPTFSYKIESDSVINNTTKAFFIKGHRFSYHGNNKVHKKTYNERSIVLVQKDSVNKVIRENRSVNGKTTYKDVKLYSKSALKKLKPVSQIPNMELVRIILSNSKPEIKAREREQLIINAVVKKGYSPIGLFPINRSVTSRVSNNLKKGYACIDTLKLDKLNIKYKKDNNNEWELSFVDTLKKTAQIEKVTYKTTIHCEEHTPYTYPNDYSFPSNEKSDFLKMVLNLKHKQQVIPSAQSLHDYDPRLIYKAAQRIGLVDVNFDGIKDIRIPIEYIGVHNSQTSWYIYSKDKQEFEYSQVLSNLPNVSVNKTTKTIHSNGRAGSVSRVGDTIKEFKYINNTLTLVKEIKIIKSKGKLFYL